jgi:hypothetical protein
MNMIAWEEIPTGRLLQAYDELLSNDEMEKEYDEQMANHSTSNWIALFCLGVCIFVFVACIQSMRNGYTETVLANPAKKFMKDKLANMFAKSGNQMELQSTNFTQCCNVEDDVETDGELVFATNNNKLQNNVSVPNCCAICLDAYKPGEFIVWSASRECPHVYHRDCMLDYLVSVPTAVTRGSPCPSCRQQFCHSAPRGLKNSDEIA